MAPPPIQVHLCVKGAENAIAFYEKAFGGACVFKRLTDDGKRVMHARMALFDSEIMMHDEFPEYAGNLMSPVSRGGASIAININLAEPSRVDAAVARAEKAGAEVIFQASDMFWGARYGQVRDPFGHIWAFNAPIPAA
jgi:PhnB protein